MKSKESNNVKSNPDSGKLDSGEPDAVKVARPVREGGREKRALLRENQSLMSDATRPTPTFTNVNQRVSEFPLFDKHHGVWEGTYTLMDARTGEILDRHQSRLTCTKNGNSWHQKNEYTWDDGRRESKEFPGVFADGALRFDNPRLRGEAFEVTPATIILTWQYKDRPGDHLAEIITLVDDRHRARTWQHFEGGEFTKLTVIDERKTSNTV